VPSGQSPSQVGDGLWSQWTIGLQRQPSTVSTKTQVCEASGHGPSQVGGLVRSHLIGSQLQPATPVVFGTHISPWGQSAEHDGYGA